MQQVLSKKLPRGFLAMHAYSCTHVSVCVSVGGCYKKSLWEFLHNWNYCNSAKPQANISLSAGWQKIDG